MLRVRERVMAGKVERRGAFGILWRMNLGNLLMD